MKLFLKASLLNSIIYFFFFSTAQAASPFIDSTDPPPGFEQFKTSQHLQVSVLFMNQDIGLFYVSINKGRLKFIAPEKMMLQMSGVKNQNHTLTLLRQEFDLNIECHSNGMATVPKYCDALENQLAFITYDPQHEKVALYLAPSFFKKPKELSEVSYIPNSSVGWSYLNKFGAAGSFSNDKPVISSKIYPSLPNYYNLYSNNVLAHGNSSIVTNLSQNNGIDDGEHFQIQNLFARHIDRNKVYSGGYIPNPFSPFIQTQIILGAGVSSTLDTVRDVSSIMATPLILFVPQASQVSIFKNEQLIYSQYLEAGYQRINTNGFPEGGYDLTVKIGSNISHRFYSKGASLPPMQATQFYVIGGYLTNGMILYDNAYNFLPQVLSVPVLQTGINKRISERIALFSDVLLNSNQGLFDFGPTVFLGNSLIKTAGLITTNSDYGFYTLLTSQRNKINLSLIATKIFYQNTKPNKVFLNNLIDNDSASLSYSLTQRDVIGVQANYNTSLLQPDSYSAGAYYQRQLGNYRGLGFYFNASYNKTKCIGDNYAVGLSMNFTQGAIVGTESVAWQNQNNAPRYNQLATPVVLQGSTLYSHLNNQGLGHSINEIHNISPNVTSLAGTYNYTARQGFIATYANYNQSQGNKQTVGYGGNLESQLVINPHSIRFNGVERGNTAGLTVRVNDELNNKSAKFALLDENQRQIAVIPANKKVFVPLPGFTDQNFTLSNLSKNDYFIKEAVRHVTLYPGNIGYYSWTVQRRVVVIGRVITMNHNHPLTNTWIHAGKNGIFSDDEGNFQLELAQDTSVLHAGNLCQIKLPQLKTSKAYLYVGDVLCTDFV